MKRSEIAFGIIKIPDGVLNIGFGGSERRTLFLTAQTQILSIELNIPGL